MKKWMTVFLALVLPGLLAATPIETPKDVPAFVRLQKSKDGTVEALQTAIVTYQKGDIKLDLVGAIHIGDRSYYRELNRQFDKYDAMLYELVAPKGVRPTGERGLMGMIAKLMLDLDSQTERVNYNKKNFVHADLSFDEMKAEMAKRGEDPLVVALKVLAESMQSKNLAKNKIKKNPLELLEAAEMAAIAKELAEAQTTTQTKRALAKMLMKQGMESGKTMKVLLIDDRNAKAMSVLEEQIKAGKKNMALYYGAAHMADFHKRLTAMGFTPGATTWITAWDLED